MSFYSVAIHGTDMHIRVESYQGSSSKVRDTVYNIEVEEDVVQGGKWILAESEYKLEIVIRDIVEV